MLRFASGIFRAGFRLWIYALLALVMILGAGPPLLIGGRLEGVIAMALGLCAWHGLRKEVRTLRDHIYLE